MMAKQKTSLMQRFLNIVERGGNALPHPATLFLGFAVITLLVSWIGSWLGWQILHPANGNVISVKNLLSGDGLHFILEKTVVNFTDFAPLGIVLVAMLGIGIAESSGLIGVAIRLLVLSAPKSLLTFVLVFAGIMSNMASDIGYVLLIPMAGVIFIAVGRHPIVGMAAAFAGVSGGFSANLFLGTIDPLLAGLSQEAAQIIDPSYVVNPTANYYFMIVSTFLISFLGTWVTEKIVAPRFGKYQPDGEEENIALERLTKKEKKGLLYSGLTFMLFLGLILWGAIPEDGVMRSEDGSLLHSPLLRGVVTLLFVVAGAMGIVYGTVVGKFKNDADVMKGMAESMKALATYIVLVFFAAQFVAYFKESNLGIVLAVNGAEALKAANLNIYVLMVLFILFAATINMLMGSASAKWAIMAPVFIPIFMLMGYSPELSQVVFRIGDSVTNIISPMMSFFALIIAFVQKYDKNAGIGTIISTMIPFSIIFFIGWTILLMAWIYFDIPLGPDSPLYYHGAAHL
ncbi:MAG: aminobenzoyl-glutamate transporter [Bacteroidetes bacterium HGW-Bacteroidetes-4]|nr:MAG: aminobenzoyl-glutamate transporter [Bacteroidetes bacterium HGW-Bacteroidetes-4]